MKPSEAIKPISYLKAHASEIVKDISANQKTMVITQNGEAKVVLQDVKVYEQLQESLALLKILARSSKNLKEKNYRPMDEVFSDLRRYINENQNTK